MKKIIVGILVSLISLTAAADQPSMSGHWRDAHGRKFFFHQAGGKIDVWLPTSNRQICFTGKLKMLSPVDDVLHAAMYEINANSNETLTVNHGNMVCKVKNPNFNLLGTLFRSGYRGRNMELRAVGNVSGTMVCGKNKQSWSASYIGSWKRL